MTKSICSLRRNPNKSGNSADDEINVESEKNKAFSVLSQIVPAAEVFFKPSGAGDKRKKSLTIKRFDPRRLKQCGHLLKPKEDPQNEKAKGEDNSKIKIMSKDEWDKRLKTKVNQADSGVTSTPVTTAAIINDGPKVVQVSKAWQEISKKNRKASDDEQEKPQDDDFLLDFGDDSDGQADCTFTLGKTVTDEVHAKRKETEKAREQSKFVIYSKSIEANQTKLCI